MLAGAIFLLVHSEANNALSTKDCTIIMDACKYMAERLHTLQRLPGGLKPDINTAFPTQPTKQ